MSKRKITLPSVYAVIEGETLVVCENDRGCCDNVGMTLKDARELARWLLRVTPEPR